MNLLLVLFQVLFGKGLCGNGKLIYIFSLLETKDTAGWDGAPGNVKKALSPIWSVVLDIETQ
jgi:hypothetical protein